uniref:40S ribosomal protein S27 n=1 Tax=Chelydra serpentina TaxID=8475 RepID=A0A8C3SG20_CHESE
MPLAKDLLHPSPEEEKRKHKKKRLVQSPNSYFMDVKCPGEAPARAGSSRPGPPGGTWRWCGAAPAQGPWAHGEGLGPRAVPHLFAAGCEQSLVTG